MCFVQGFPPDTYLKTVGNPSDGLDDGDEVNKYHTDPNNPDTDGDGLLVR